MAFTAFLLYLAKSYIIYRWNKLKKWMSTFYNNIVALGKDDTDDNGNSVKTSASGSGNRHKHTKISYFWGHTTTEIVENNSED